MKINDESDDSEDIIDLEDEEFNPDEDASGSDNRPKRGRKKSRKRSSSGASSKRRSSITEEDEDLEDEIPAIAIKGSSKPYKPSLKKALKKKNIGEFLIRIMGRLLGLVFTNGYHCPLICKLAITTFKKAQSY